MLVNLDIDKKYIPTLKDVVKGLKGSFEIIENEKDDEMSEKDLKAYKKAKKGLEKGDTISHDELKRQLNL